MNSMRYGDKDGFREIYDEKGELILHPGEKTLVTEENVVPSFKSTWRYYGGDYLLEPSKGNLYLTNERLIFINIPERMFAIGNNDEARAMGAPMESSFELGDMSPGAAIREYFEIPNIEIMGSEKKEGAVSVGVMVNVFILSSGNQYHLSTVLTSDSDLLMRLMNKRVDNLDQLVNNLKDFFRKTDWMYMEGEKKLYNSVKKGQEPLKKSDPSPVEPSQPTVLPQSPIKKPVFQNNPPPQTYYRSPINREVGAKSKEYFENLYRKGLIKEEIYKKLMVQYQTSDTGIDMPQQRSYSRGEEEPITPPSPALPVEDDPGSGEIIEENSVPEPASPVDPSEEAIDGDNDLLSMLSDTLSDLNEDEVQDPEETDGTASTPKPIIAKKVHKVK